MKKNISLLLLTTIMFSGAVYAAGDFVIWDGSAFNVTDQDVKIKGDDIELPAGTTTIQAATVDVKVKIKSAHLRSNTAGASTLNLVANEGRTLTVHIDKKLKLDHSDDETESTVFPISLVMQGAGNVEIIVGEEDND